MNNDIETIAKRILDKDPKYIGYRITRSYHVKGTNIDTVEAKVNELTIILTIDHDSGQLLDKKESRLQARSITEPPITVTDTLNARQSSAYFELEKPITIQGDKIDSTDMQLIFDESNPNSLIGFRILLQNGTNDEIEDAYQRARRLTNFLSIQMGTYLDHKRPETLIAKPQVVTHTKSFTVDVILSKKIDLDLTNSNLSEVINNSDPTITQKIADAVAGFQAYEDKNFKDAIRNFWLVIENENLNLPKNYKSLRDGLSHSEITYPNVIADLQNDFHLNCKTKINSTKNPPGVYVDTNDLNNRQIIRQEAAFLSEQVIKFLSSRL